MAEAIAAVGVAASIIAVVELAGRIAKICKFYIDTTKDYPRDLRLIYVEIGSLKVIFEGLTFLDPHDSADSTTLKALLRNDGPVQHCKKAVEDLEKLFPPVPPTPAHSRKRPKREVLQAGLVSLAWPLKAEKSRRLLEEIMQYKSTIAVALQGQLLSVFSLKPS